jgi:signal transduction histidine kinase/CheY-like chemotaxis protein
LLSLAFAVAPRAAARDSRASEPAITHWSQVPNVTADEAAALDGLRRSGRTFVYGSLLGTEYFIDRFSGEPGGFSESFCQFMSKFFDLPFQTRLCKWNELAAGLRDHTVSFTNEYSATPERLADGYFMTDGVIDRYYKVYSLAGSETPENLLSWRPLRAGFLAGSSIAAKIGPLLDARGLLYEAVAVASVADVYGALRDGTIDFFYGENSHDAILNQYREIVGEDFLPLTYTAKSLATQDPMLEPIISVLQKFFTHGGITTVYQLYLDGTKSYGKYNFSERLTTDEAAFIRAHGPANPVPYALMDGDYPNSDYDAETRRWRGIVPDVLREIEDLTNLSLKRAHAAPLPPPALAAMLASDEAAFILDSKRKLEAEKSGEFLWTDATLETDDYVLISRADTPCVSTGQIIYSRVGLVVGTPSAAEFQARFPDHRQETFYPTFAVAVEALERGAIDLLMASENVFLASSMLDHRLNIRVNFTFPSAIYSHFALNRSQFLLRSILEKALPLTDAERIADEWKNKVFDYRGKLAEERLPFLVAGLVLAVLLLILSAALIWRKRAERRKLRNVVAERTRELEIQIVVAREQTELAEKNMGLAYEASLAKSRFLSNMSHEIRTPMNVIIGMTKLAQGANEAVKRNDFLMKIEAAAKHLLGVINDVLDMSKIEAGRFELAPAPFKLSKMLQTVVMLIDPLSEVKRQTLTTNIAPNFPDVLLGDEQRLAQVLINLLSNAVKFTPKEGNIGVAMNLLGTYDSGVDKVCELEFRVSDDGIGLTEAEQKKLFTPFTQATLDTTRKFGGTGLGLALSKRLVELMNGRIWIESKKGRGSTFAFTVRLPRRFDADLPQVNKIDTVPLGAFVGKRLLLAEDVEVNREVVIEILDATGVTIDCAENGGVAVEKYSTAATVHPYDIVLMDVQMPEMDGLEATRQIRRYEREHGLAPTLVVALTADVFAEDIKKCLDAGMNAHLAKPLNFDELLALLQKNFFPKKFRGGGE